MCNKSRKDGDHRKDDEDEAEFKFYGESYILDKEKHELDRRRAASWLRLQDLMVREPLDTLDPGPMCILPRRSTRVGASNHTVTPTAGYHTLNLKLELQLKLQF